MMIKLVSLALMLGMPLAGYAQDQLIPEDDAPFVTQTFTTDATPLHVAFKGKRPPFNRHQMRKDNLAKAEAKAEALQAAILAGADPSIAGDATAAGLKKEKLCRTRHRGKPGHNLSRRCP